jgi:glycosyltransferase involved in cell wall biosynthesis
MSNDTHRPEVIAMLPSNRRHVLLRKGPDFANRMGVAEALETLGFQVEFLDVHPWPLNPLAGRPSLFSSIDPLRAAEVLVRRRNAMAVVSYYQSGVLLVLALRRLLGFKPLVVIIDIGDDRNWRVRERIVRFCIARADAVFTFASAQAAYLRKKYNTEAIHFLPQQVDTCFYSPGTQAAEDFVLAVGGDISRDFETLGRAIFGQEFPVVLRTSLVMEDRDRFPNVSVVRDRLSDSGLRDLYRRAKIVTLPLHDTLHPGGITTLLEAFACGKAMVAGDSRGIRDYLRHENNCLVVPCGDADAMQSAVRRLMNDDGLRERLGRNARAYAEAELSQPCHAKRLAEAIRSLRTAQSSSRGPHVR